MRHTAPLSITNPHVVWREGLCDTRCVILHAGGLGEQHEDLDFFVPPPWAIAHHLVKIWAEQGTAWFSSAKL